MFKVLFLIFFPLCIYSYTLTGFSVTGKNFDENGYGTIDLSIYASFSGNRNTIDILVRHLNPEDNLKHSMFNFTSTTTNVTTLPFSLTFGADYYNVFVTDGKDSINMDVYLEPRIISTCNTNYVPYIQTMDINPIHMTVTNPNNTYPITIKFDVDFDGTKKCDCHVHCHFTVNGNEVATYDDDNGNFIIDLPVGTHVIEIDVNPDNCDDNTHLKESRTVKIEYCPYTTVSNGTLDCSNNFIHFLTSTDLSAIKTASYDMALQSKFVAIINNVIYFYDDHVSANPFIGLCLDQNGNLISSCVYSNLTIGVTGLTPIGPVLDLVELVGTTLGMPLYFMGAITLPTQVEKDVMYQKYRESGFNLMVVSGAMLVGGIAIDETVKQKKLIAYEQEMLKVTTLQKELMKWGNEAIKNTVKITQNGNLVSLKETNMYKYIISQGNDIALETSSAREALSRVKQYSNGIDFEQLHLARADYFIFSRTDKLQKFDINTWWLWKDNQFIKLTSKTEYEFWNGQCPPRTTIKSPEEMRTIEIVEIDRAFVDKNDPTKVMLLEVGGIDKYSNDLWGWKHQIHKLRKLQETLYPKGEVFGIDATDIPVILEKARVK